MSHAAACDGNIYTIEPNRPTWNAAIATKLSTFNGILGTLYIFSVLKIVFNTCKRSYNFVYIISQQAILKGRKQMSSNVRMRSIASIAVLGGVACHLITVDLIYTAVSIINQNGQAWRRSLTGPNT